MGIYFCEHNDCENTTDDPSYVDDMSSFDADGLVSKWQIMCNACFAEMLEGVLGDGNDKDVHDRV